MPQASGDLLEEPGTRQKTLDDVCGEDKVDKPHVT